MSRHPDTWSDDECEAWTQARQQSTPREADEAADRAWQQRITQGATAAAELERQWRNR